jgi:FKBP-type peptidyl-prolyl cis-trans isomerase
MRHRITWWAFAIPLIYHATAPVPGFTREAERRTERISLPPLSYELLSSGAIGGAHPDRKDIVIVNYSVRERGGPLIDSTSWRSVPDRFELNKLIPAWQVLLPKMILGDVWRFHVPPDYAYGSLGREEIPPDAFLVFEVELLSFEKLPLSGRR